LAGDLVIYGAGGMGQEVADLVSAAAAAADAGADGARWHLLGFVDDDRSLHGRQILGLPVLGGHEWLAGRSGHLGRPPAVALAIGAPAARRRAWGGLLRSAAGVDVTDAPPLVHPTAYVGRGSHLGPGAIVGAHATVTADVQVGDFSIVNVGATVSHNTRLGDFATIAPGAHLAGNVSAGEGVDVGIGAAVGPGRTIGEWSVVGAGAVVLDDVDANTTVVGCPARIVAKRDAGWYR
jgi:sugar O-acyltransferase (sialic acid O-acetyltransferase NeuD family)